MAGYGYSYDDANRLLGIDFLPSAYNGEDVSYTYDDRGQIDTADYSGTGGIEENYYFDANGNRTGAQVIGGVTETYNSLAGTNNRLLYDGTFTYAYDNNGNRTARFIDSGNGVLGAGDTAITEYEWDHRNRLTSVTERVTYGGAATQTVEYDYDYLNQLVSRTVDSTDRTIYAYNDGQVVLQFEGDVGNPLEAGDLSNHYLWGPVVDQLLADEEIDWTNNEANGEVLWALTDHLGTVRDLVNSSGVVQNHKSYDAFGNVTAETNAAKDTVFGFTGKLFDDATGLQNNLNRWYDARVGSWLSEDPIGFAGGDANLTRYVGNVPTKYVDPLGLDGGATAVGGGFFAGTIGWGGAISGLAGGAAIGGAAIGGFEFGTWLGGDWTSDWGTVVGNWWVPGPDESISQCRYPDFTGTPDSTTVGDQQTREYGEDGYPQTDVDTGHNHGSGDPHAHDWTRPVGGGPPTHNDRGPGRPLRPGDPPPPNNAPSP